MVRNLKAIRQFADCDFFASRESHHGKECLVFLRREPGASRSFFAEVQELAKAIPKGRQRFVFPLCDRWGRSIGRAC